MKQLLSVREGHSRDFETVVWKPYGNLSRFGAIVACGLVLLIVGAGDRSELTYQEYRNNRQQIASLKRQEREQLERNLEYYHSLTPAEQDRYWELHRYVTENQLQPLVDQYTEWLATLSPFERERLRNLEEPAARMAAVKSMLDEHRKEDKRLLPELMARIVEQGDGRLEHISRMLDPNISFNQSDPFLLSDEELNTLVNEIVFSQLNASQRDQIDELDESGLERMIRILGTSIANMNEPWKSWPNNQILERTREAGIVLPTSPSDETKRFFQFLPEGAWERLAFRSLVIRSLLVSEMREFEKKSQVSSSDLHSFFTELESSEQAALINSPAEYQAEALKWLYLWDKYKNQSVLLKREFLFRVLGQLRPHHDDRDRRRNDRHGDGPPPPEKRGEDRPERSGPPPFRPPR